MRAIFSASAKLASQEARRKAKLSGDVCRHGWPMPTHLASRRVTRDGITTFVQVSQVTRDAGCPDAH